MQCQISVELTIKQAGLVKGKVIEMVNFNDDLNQQARKP